MIDFGSILEKIPYLSIQFGQNIDIKPEHKLYNYDMKIYDYAIRYPRGFRHRHTIGFLTKPNCQVRVLSSDNNRT